MFRYNAISKEEYINEHKILCDTDPYFKKVDFTLNCYRSARVHIKNEFFSYDDKENWITRRNLLLSLLCCDKINKKVLLRQILEHLVWAHSRNDKIWWLEPLQITSSFINFESALSQWTPLRINKIMCFLIKRGFPIELFGKYGKEWSVYHSNKMNRIKLVLANFPLDVLKIVEQFLPFEKPLEKSNCCIQ